MRMAHLNRLRIMIWCSLIALSSLQVQAAQENIQGQGDGNQGFPISVNFEYQYRHMFVKLNTNILGTLTFMVDSGSEHSVVSDGTMKGQDRPLIVSKQRVNIFNGYGKGARAEATKTANLTLYTGSRRLFEGSFLVLDIQSVERKLENPIDGILGWDFFQQYCTTINFATKEMLLYAPGSCSAPKDAHGTIHGVWSPHGLAIDSVITFPNSKSVKARLHFDTGSDWTVFLNPKFRKVAGLGSTGPVEGQTEGTGINGTYKADIVRANTVDFEYGRLRYDLKQDATIGIGRRGSFSSAHWWEARNDTAEIDRDGNIGNGLLEKLIWTLDPAQKKVYVVVPPKD